MNKHREIGKYISILQRLSNAYFSNRLASYPIGSGQQFFLLQIFRCPGMNLQELASQGKYDKATSTRAVKKLEKEGYVQTEMVKEDKRVRRIFPTSKAKDVVEKTLESAEDWTEIILDGFTAKERDAAEQMLIRMASNACKHTTELKGKD